jgi:DHA2 family multidrug resistance protein
LSEDISHIPDPNWRPRHNPWAIAMTVTMATFMEVLDSSIANVSLPHIAGNLSVTVDESTWILTSYLVSNAIVLPISGWLATRFGRKRFYMTCVLIFTLSSFMCGLAPNLATLLICRIVQGLGGGGLGPSEQAILADTFPPAKRGMAFAAYGMAVVLAPAIGPTLGGWITDSFSWRWIFFINVPVGTASLLLTRRMVEDPPWLAGMKKRAGSIDYIGLSLIAVGLGCLEVVLDKGQEDDWFQSSFILGFAAIAAVTLVTFVVWELSQDHPVVDVRLFKIRNFAAANVMMLVLGATLYGSTVLLPEYLQVIMGYTAQKAGNALSIGAVVIILMLPMIGILVSRVDARWLVAFGFTALSIAMFYMAHHLYADIDFATAAKLRIYQSFGLAFLFVPINTLVYAGIPLEKNNSVSGIVNLARNMGGDIGIAFVTTFVARRAVLHQNQIVTHLYTTNPGVSQRLSGIAKGLVSGGMEPFVATQRAMGGLFRTVFLQAQTLAFLDAIWFFGLVVACMVPLIFLMQRPARRAPAGAH